jgi:hypothetical protein
MSLFLAMLISAAPAHPELGKVTWLRDLEVALQQSRASGKPVLVLFDEVPGCATVRGFGRDVLSVPAVVSRIERDFVPVAILNNVPGPDRVVLEAFGEPSWNNPVVRIIDADRTPLARRFDGPYSIEAFSALLESVRPAAAPSVERLVVSAHCFWECEARLGKLPAVVASRVGFLNGEEVVEVAFDRSVSTREQLVREAAQLDCATHVFSSSEAEHAIATRVVGARAVLTSTAMRESAKDTKYYLKQSRRAKEPLTALEQVRVNAALRFGEDVDAARASCAKR